MICRGGGEWFANACSLNRNQLIVLRRKQREAGVPWWHSPPEEQLHNLMRWNRDLRWRIAESEFRFLTPPPPRPEGKLTAVVLVAYMGTVAETFHRWCQAIQAQLGRYWRLGGLRCDADYLRLLGSRTQPCGVLVWETIDLGANEGESAVSVRSPELSPHAGVLAAAAQHHRWAFLMDGWYRALYVRLAGYEARRRRNSRMAYVPSMFWTRENRKLNLALRPADEADKRYVVPRFVA